MYKLTEQKTKKTCTVAKKDIEIMFCASSIYDLSEWSNMTYAEINNGEEIYINEENDIYDLPTYFITDKNSNYTWIIYGLYVPSKWFH